MAISHTWAGRTAFEESKAVALAQQGYVGFAIDMYGKDQVTQHADTASGWKNQITANEEIHDEVEILSILECVRHVDDEWMFQFG